MVAVARRSGDSGSGATGDARGARVRHGWFVTAAVEQGRSRAACVRRADPCAPADRAPRAARLPRPLVGAPRPPAAGAGSGARVRRTRINERGVTKEARRANADRGLTESAQRADPRAPADRAPRASRGRSWARPAHRPPARGVERGSGARGSTSEDERMRRPIGTDIVRAPPARLFSSLVLLSSRRRSSSLSRVFSSVAAPCGARERRARGRRASVVGVVRCVGIAAWGFSWPQEEEPRGRAAGAQKSRRSYPDAHPGNYRFIPCFFSRRIPWPHQRLKWPMALVVSVQSAPATEMAALMSVQSAPETEMAALVSVQSAPETETAAWGSAPD